MWSPLRSKTKKPIFLYKTNLVDSSYAEAETSYDEDPDDFNKKLHFYSTLRLKEFNTLFIALVDKFSLPENKRDSLLEFIRLLLPQENNLPKTYYMIKKGVNASEIKEISLCKGFIFFYSMLYLF